MSYIPTVEKWIEDLRRRMEPVPEDTPYYRELKAHLEKYEKLLADLRAKHPKPAEREPGEEG